MSLTADPVEEVYAARDILKAAGLRKDGVNIVACPTCGRTRIDLIGLASRVEEAVSYTHLVANVFGQLGDLSTSLIKREAGIKDYSHIFLTHGGVLDRLDSILFIAPVVYAAVMWMEGVL